jgi:hypothetical protein
MSVRDLINKHQKTTLIIVPFLILAAISFIYYSNARPNPAGRRVTTNYFSDDDGQTFFSSAADQIPPFDHDGKPAVRAYVFKDDGGQPFIGYLEKYSDDTKQKLAALMNDPANNAQAIADLMTSSALVKKPGDSAWQKRFSDAGAAVTQVPASRDGSAVVALAP